MEAQSQSPAARARAGTGPAAGPVGGYPVQGWGSAVPGSFRLALGPPCTRLRSRSLPGGL